MSLPSLIAELRQQVAGRHSTWHDLATLLELGALTLTDGNGPARVEGRRVALPSGDGSLQHVKAAWWRAVVRRERATERPAPSLAALGSLTATVDPGRELLSEWLTLDLDDDSSEASGRGRLRRELLLAPAENRPSRSQHLASAALANPVMPPARDDPGSDLARVEQLVSALNEGKRVGLLGAAATGKSTLAAAVLQARPGTPVLHGDQFTWPGDGFRYTQHTCYRTTRLSGPYITHHDALLSTVSQAQGAVLVEGTTVGWDPALRDQLDVLVLVHLDAATRLSRKVTRDAGQRGLALELDFAEKQFLELQDVCVGLASEVDWVWHRTAVDDSLQT